MNEFDVPPFEMDDNAPSDFDIGAALNGDQTAGSAAVREYLGGLRRTFETSADVPVGAALAEFIDVIDVVDLTTTTVAATAPGKKRKMITGIGTFIATTTGKIVLGTTVAAASVGGAHAVDLVDVPGLPDAAVEVVELDETTESEETLDEVIQVTPTDTEDEADESVEKAGDESDAAEENELAVLDNAEDTDANSEEEPRNHGELVSEFAHTTELEGCERGQAIADEARMNGEQKRQARTDDGEVNEDGYDIDVDEDIDVDTSIELDQDIEAESDNKCKNHDESEDDEVTKSEDDDEDGSSENGNGHSQGKGKGLSKKN